MTTATGFLRNCWYMAAWSHELGTALLRRRLLGEPVLLMRRQDGTAAALIDRCPHRFAPLSMGTRQGDTITCAYHGLRFDSHGHCVGNPFSDQLPKGAQLRSFPVQERDGIVWLWAGDPAAADAARIPDFSMLAVPGHGPPIMGLLPMQAPFEYGIDNLMDLSHIEFVHRGSFAGRGVIFAGTHSVHENDQQLHSNWWMPDIAAPPHTFGVYDPQMRCDHWLDMRWEPAASMYLQVGACPTGAPRETGVIAHQAHILTPETATTSHYFWATTRTGPPSAQGDAMLAGLMRQAFETEDKPLIEAAWANLDGAGFWESKPLFLGVDAGGARARRLLERLVQREAAG
jgi:phenylpropionate dioxygenase-like ring-hydroxylating dioxygenase large terminal subunit